MNTQGEEDECLFHNYFSILRCFGNNVRTFIANKFLRIKNWDQKPSIILKLRYKNVYNFQENLRRKKS